jgi:hypothetical protein
VIIESCGPGKSIQFVGVSQGYKLTGTVKIAETRRRNLVHCGAPLTAWRVGIGVRSVYEDSRNLLVF